MDNDKYLETQTKIMTLLGATRHLPIEEFLETLVKSKQFAKTVNPTMYAETIEQLESLQVVGDLILKLKTEAEKIIQRDQRDRRNKDARRPS